MTKITKPAVTNAAAKIATIKYELFHASYGFWTKMSIARNETTTEEFRKAFQCEYHWVHDFEYPATDIEKQLKRLFEESQNIDEAWRPDHPCRSTCVGDLVKVGKDVWLVDSVGFRKLWTV
jgi:hypothetical protein